MALTVRQQKFAEAFAQCGNQAMAVRIAGYEGKNAKQVAYQMMKLPEVLEAVHQANKRRIVDNVPVFLNVLEALASNPETPPAVRAQVAIKGIELAGHKPPDRQEVQLLMDERTDEEILTAIRARREMLQEALIEAPLLTDMPAEDVRH